MYIAASLVITLLLALAFNNTIKRYSVIWYGIAILLVIFEWAYYEGGLRSAFPGWFTTYFINVFKRGAFSTALFVIVMYTGILKPDWGAAKKLKRVRGELSIIACLLTLGHNLIYGKTHFVKLFTNPGTMKPQHLIAAIISLAMLAIMLPLMVTSFQRVRRKMKDSAWKRLQRWAYVFFALLYIHIMVLFIPKAEEKWLAILVYSFVFGGYFLVKVSRKAAPRSARSLLPPTRPDQLPN